MIDIWEALGWAASGLNIWGNLALTSKGVHGWIVRLASNVLWIAYSAWAGAWPLLVNHILFAGINGWGWYKWTKEDRIAAQAWAEMEAAEEEYRRKRDEQIDQDRKARLFVRD